MEYEKMEYEKIDPDKYQVDIRPEIHITKEHSVNVNEIYDETKNEISTFTQNQEVNFRAFENYIDQFGVAYKPIDSKVTENGYVQDVIEFIPETSMEEVRKKLETYLSTCPAEFIGHPEFVDDSIFESKINHLEHITKEFATVFRYDDLFDEQLFLKTLREKFPECHFLFAFEELRACNFDENQELQVIKTFEIKEIIEVLKNLQSITGPANANIMAANLIGNKIEKLI